VSWKQQNEIPNLNDLVLTDWGVVVFFSVYQASEHWYLLPYINSQQRSDFPLGDYVVIAKVKI
jgi:hypothetical protein